MWTTQAPHWLVSQPTWVPVRFSCSRSRCTSRVRSSASTTTALPFTVNLTVDTLSSHIDFYLFRLETVRLQLCNRHFHSDMMRSFLVVSCFVVAVLLVSVFWV